MFSCHLLSRVHIPEEILSEILTPLFKLSDEVFSDTSAKPLLAPGYSSATYLLVCKTWLRVATPLLYNVVIFRTTAQAVALDKVLRLNKEFGLFVRKLRVEGGFGPVMHSVLKAAPNITDVFLTLSLWGSANVSGLCSGLRLINPQRIILADCQENGEAPRVNKQVTRLMDTLVELIPKWNRLVRRGYDKYSSGKYQQSKPDKLLPSIRRRQRSVRHLRSTR